MGVTSSTNELFRLDAPEDTPDYDRPIPDAELAAALLAQTRPVSDGEFVDVDVRGDDAFGT